MRLVGNGFVTELPEGWEDRSLITLSGPPGKTGFVSNVVVTRERLAGDLAFEDYLEAQRAAPPLPDLEILDESATEVDGTPAYQRLQRLRIESHHLQQQQTFVLAPGRVVFVITATSTVEEFDQCFPLFRRVLESFRLFDPETAVR